MGINPRSPVGCAASLLIFAMLAVFSLPATLSAAEGSSVDLPVFRKWSGDYPVAQLDRLPEGQRRSRIGYLGEQKEFAAVWEALKPDEEVPGVDFGRNIVVFSRNVVFYNRTSILKVALKEGVAEILAMETMSARPIEDKAAMALAEIPRAGVRFLQAGSERIPVLQNESAADPRNATYMVDGRQVSLHDGRCETEAAPGSASRIATVVFGKPAAGDLDGDGDEDAALFLMHSPGGSGTFYYVAASVNDGDGFRGTNAVLLGDRISPQQIGIRDGVVVVDYADRRPDDPMAAPPSVGKSKYLILHNGRLTERMPHREGK